MSGLPPLAEAELDLAAERWLDGELDPALAARLCADAAARAAFVARLRDWQLIQAVLRPAAVGLVPAVLAAAPQAADRRLARALAARVRPRAWPRVGLALLAAAAILLLLLPWGPRPEQAEATLPAWQVSSGQLQDEGGALHGPGAQPEPGRWYRARDALTLQHLDGSRSWLAAGSRLRVLADAAGLELDHGQVTCQVTPRLPGQAQWRVATPLATVAVLGTRFSVAVEAAQATVAVHEGRVEVQPPGGERLVLVAAEAAWIDGLGRTLRGASGALWRALWHPQADQLIAGRALAAGGWRSQPVQHSLPPHFPVETYVQFTPAAASDPALFVVPERARLRLRVSAGRAGRLWISWQEPGSLDPPSYGSEPIALRPGSQELLVEHARMRRGDGSAVTPGTAVRWLAVWEAGAEGITVHELSVEQAVDTALDLSPAGVP